MAEKTARPKHPWFNTRTPLATARFPHVHKPDEYKGKKKFKITLVFDGEADTSKITEDALAVAAAVYPNRKPEKVNVLLKDGDDAEKNGEPIEELAGKTYMTVGSNEEHPPTIVGPDRKPLPAGMEVRGGDLVKAIVTPIPSDTPVPGTIAFRLVAVQLIEKRAGGGDRSSLFDDEGEGFGGPADDKPSTGVQGGEGALDDDEIPF